MTVFWLCAMETLFVTVVTLYAAMLRDIWHRRVWNKQREVHIEKETHWSSLTEADRQWFQANLWDGKKVLDEPVVPDEPKPLRAIDCKHPNTVSETSIQDAGVRLICMDCGLTWIED